MAIAIALLGFNDLGRSVNPTSKWEGKKNSRFLSARHRILPSCGFKEREIVVAKCELAL